MVQYSPQLDTSFAALSDPTRRGILERLGRGDASISALAANFEMTLTGVKKHVKILEGAGLVTTQKVGRVRRIAKHRQMLEARLDRLGKFLEHTKGAQS